MTIHFPIGISEHTALISFESCVFSENRRRKKSDEDFIGEIIVWVQRERERQWKQEH